jgi:hypothetical protein
VTHYPGGKQVMTPANTLADALNAQEMEFKSASADLRQAALDRVEEKRERQEAGTAVPSDKSPV